MSGWLDNLMGDIKRGDLAVPNSALWKPSSWRTEARGVGFTGAARSALANFIVIKHGRLRNDQAVVPSTWNAGPRDAKGQPGPYEAALMDSHNLYDPKRPLEIPAHDSKLRSLHRLGGACRRSTDRHLAAYVEACV